MSRSRKSFLRTQWTVLLTLVMTVISPAECYLGVAEDHRRRRSRRRDSANLQRVFLPTFPSDNPSSFRRPTSISYRGSCKLSAEEERAAEAYLGFHHWPPSRLNLPIQQVIF